MSDTPEKARDAVERTIRLCDVLLELVQMDDVAFLGDLRSQWAVELGLIRVGETINRVPDDVLERYPGQPWRQIIGMRNLAVHQYDDLAPRRVWRTATRDVPRLRSYLVDVVVPGLGPSGTTGGGGGPGRVD